MICCKTILDVQGAPTVDGVRRLEEDPLHGHLRFKPFSSGKKYSAWLATTHPADLKDITAASSDAGGLPGPTECQTGKGTVGTRPKH
jgi:hypothetical protein